MVRALQIALPEDLLLDVLSGRVRIAQIPRVGDPGVTEPARLRAWFRGPEIEPTSFYRMAPADPADPAQPPSPETLWISVEHPSFDVVPPGCRIPRVKARLVPVTAADRERLLSPSRAPRKQPASATTQNSAEPNQAAAS